MARIVRASLPTPRFARPVATKWRNQSNVDMVIRSRTARIAGPRFSIVNEVPYDRANTTMADFAMCPACRSEYVQPADRRFHAQPIACPDCGPSIWLEALDSIAAGNSSEVDALGAAVELLDRGAVVAVRGLGGFHLACDATNPEAVLRLRQPQASLRQTVRAYGQRP